MPDQSRQLAAIMFTDIEGYTALMQADEEQAIRYREKHRQIFESYTEKHQGRILQYYGDGTLSIFDSAIDAVLCAIGMQKEFQLDPMIPVRIGIHSGDIIYSDEEIIGDGVNVASRIESLATAGSVFISDKVYDDIKNQNSIQTEAIGSFDLKNVKEPVAVYAVSNQGLIVPSLNQIKGKIKSGNLLGLLIKGTVIGLMLLIVLVGGFFFYLRDPAGNHAVMTKSIAVLPLVNMSNDPEQDYFSDGLTEDILTQLSKIGELRVVSRTSIMKYKNTAKSIPEIGEELGVAYILEGSVRKHEDKVRITVQLIEAATDNHIWAEDFDRELKDIFAIQSDVSLEVAKVLDAKLTSAEKKRVKKIPTENAEAYSKYQQGKEIIRRGGGTSEERDQALMLFQEAIKADPKFGQAYVGLADTHISFLTFGHSTSKEALPKALEAALKGLSIDDEMGECYASLGAVYFYLNDLETSENYLNKAIDITPSYDMSYNWMGWLKLLQGDLDQAVDFFGKAYELDPLGSGYQVQIALGYYWYRDYDKALEVVSKVLADDPGNKFALWQKANVLTAQGKYQEAVETFHIRTVGAQTNWMLGYTYGVAENREEAQRILNYQLEKRETEYVPAYMIGVIYVGLGERDKALDWLEKAYDEGYGIPFIFGMRYDHSLDDLRDEPRFKDLYAKMKFPE